MTAHAGRVIGGLSQQNSRDARAKQQVDLNLTKHISLSIGVLEAAYRTVDGYEVSADALFGLGSQDLPDGASGQYTYGEAKDLEEYVRILEGSEELCLSRRRMLESMPGEAGCSCGFVDLGAGVGKSVAVASCVFGVQQAVGVELVPALCAVAELTIRSCYEAIGVGRSDGGLPALMDLPPSLERARIICGDVTQGCSLLAAGSPSASVIFVNAVTWPEEAWEQVLQLLVDGHMRDGAELISVGRKIGEAFVGVFIVSRVVQFRMSWADSVGVHYYRLSKCLRQCS